MDNAQGTGLASSTVPLIARQRRLLALASVLLVSSFGGEVVAQTENVEARIARGLSAYASGDDETAIAELEAAVDANARPVALLALGYAQMRGGHPAAAQRSLERFLEDDLRVTKRLRTEIEAAIAQLREKTAYLSVTSNIEGSVVSLDGVVVGETPLDPLLVDAGKHTVKVFDGQLPPISAQVELVPRSDEQLRLDFDDAPKSYSFAGRVDSDVPLWLPWTTAAVMAVGAAGFGVLTFTTSRSVDELKRIPTSSDAEVADADARVLSLAVTTGVLSGLAVGSLGASLFLTLSQPDRAEDEIAWDLRISPSRVQLEVEF